MREMPVRYAERAGTAPRRITLHSLLVFTATFAAIVLAAAALLDMTHLFN